MAWHNAYAVRVNDENLVDLCICIPYLNDDDDEITAYCNSLGLAGRWLDTSYTGSRRGVYASVGYAYDPVNDVFVSPVIPENNE